jgi:hypothetical protein
MLHFRRMEKIRNLMRGMPNQNRSKMWKIVR